MTDDTHPRGFSVSPVNDGNLGPFLVISAESNAKQTL